MCLMLRGVELRFEEVKALLIDLNNLAAARHQLRTLVVSTLLLRLNFQRHNV